MKLIAGLRQVSGMPRCPECKEPIEFLLEVCCEYVADEVKLDCDGELEYEGCPETRDSELIHFECPNCNEVLFCKSNDAKLFLKGGKK